MSQTELALEISLVDCRHCGSPARVESYQDPATCIPRTFWKLSCTGCTFETHQCTDKEIAYRRWNDGVPHHISHSWGANKGRVMTMDEYYNSWPKEWPTRREATR